MPVRTPRSARYDSPATTSAFPSPEPWRDGSMPITKISPSSGSASVVGWTLVQQDPASPSASKASRNPFGSNHGSAMRRSRVARTQPPCSGWSANARLLTASHTSSSCPGTKDRTSTPGGHDGGSAKGSGTRSGRRSRWCRNPARAAASSSRASGSKIQSTTRPPPSAATCSTARSSNAASASGLPRTSRCTTTPAAQWGGEKLSLRYTYANPTGRPSSVASTPADTGSSGSSRSRQTASPRDGRPSTASTSSCSCVTVTRSAAVTGCRRRVSITAKEGTCGSRYLRLMARPRGAKQRAAEIVQRLAAEYPGTAKELCALQHGNPYQLLVATILSAQSTDETVNKITPALFERYPTPADLAHANPDEVEELIHASGFFRSKTKSLILMARVVEERFGGEVPSDIDQLDSLPGVGRKTGNVVRSVAC